MKKILKFISRIALAGLLAMNMISANASLYNASGQDAQQADTPAPNYWNEKGQGWFWYKDPAVQTPEPKKAPPKQAKKKKTIYEMTSVEEIKKEVKRLMDRAIINPTEANMKEFLKANQYVMEKGALFSDQWRRVVWKTPELDYALQHPVNTAALDTYKADLNQKQAQNVTNLSKNYGLFFFFRSDCPYCHAFAPTLKYFSQQYGIEVFPVSLDGAGLPEYPNPRPNNGIAEKLRVTTVPAVFLGDKANNSVTPIGYGVMSMTELMERIYTLTQVAPGRSY